MIRIARLPIPEALDGDAFVAAQRWTDPTPHKHIELELNIVLRGSSRCLARGRSYSLRPGTMLWLFPDHHHILLDQSADFKMWVGVFRKRLTKKLCGGKFNRLLMQRNPDGYFCRTIPVAKHRELCCFLESFITARNDPPRFNAALGYLLLQAWSIYSGEGASIAGRELHPSVVQASHLLCDEGQEFELDELARRSCLSASRLGRLFKKQMGMSIVEFRNKQRIDRVLAQCGNGRRTKLLHAALQAGFGSYTHFHRVFSQLMSCSPREYSQKLRQAPYAPI